MTDIKNFCIKTFYWAAFTGVTSLVLCLLIIFTAMSVSVIADTAEVLVKSLSTFGIISAIALFALFEARFVEVTKTTIMSKIF